MLKTADMPVKKFHFDTMLAHYLLDENSQHGLGKIVPIYTDMGNYKDEVGDYIRGKIKILNKGIREDNTGKTKKYFNEADEKVKKVDAFRS